MAVTEQQQATEACILLVTLEKKARKIFLWKKESFYSAFIKKQNKAKQKTKQHLGCFLEGNQTVGEAARAAKQLGERHQELPETAWEQLEKGKAVQGLFPSESGYPVTDLLWLSTKKATD